TSSCAELALDLRRQRLTCLHNVPQNAVDDVLVKDSKVPIREEIALQRFQFEAKFVWGVLNGDGAEIRKTGFGTDRCEFRQRNGNRVTGKLVGPAFDRGQFGVDSGL